MAANNQFSGRSAARPDAEPNIGGNRTKLWVHQGEDSMRKQYYFQHSDHGLLAWDVDRLIELTSGLPRKWVPLGQIRELDEEWFGEDERPTWRALLEHVRLIEEADLSYPIILSASGAVMDGMHRVAKTLLEGGSGIEAVQFDEDPEPDHVGLGPADLPY